MTAKDERLLMPGEAAARLEVSVVTLRRWTNQGKLRCVVLPSGRRKYRESDIDACLLPFLLPDPPAPDARPGASPPGRVKRLPGARKVVPRGLQAGVKRPRSRLAAPETSPGARLAQPASHQRGTTAGLVAARAPGGHNTYGGGS